MPNYNTIAESNNFIVLEKYDKYTYASDAFSGYQTEVALEREFIQDLVNLGYENATHIKSLDQMLANARVQIEALNSMIFTDKEWSRFLEEYLNKASDDLVAKTNKIQNNHIYDFVFDDGHIQNIYLVDKKEIARNRVQVLSQFEQKGTHANRYDVTILINGLPLVQVELKSEALLFVKHSIKYTATVKRV